MSKFSSSLTHFSPFNPFVDIYLILFYHPRDFFQSLMTFFSLTFTSLARLPAILHSFSLPLAATEGNEKKNVKLLTVMSRREHFVLAT